MYLFKTARFSCLSFLKYIDTNVSMYLKKPKKEIQKSEFTVPPRIFSNYFLQMSCVKLHGCLVLKCFALIKHHLQITFLHLKKCIYVF